MRVALALLVLVPALALAQRPDPRYAAPLYVGVRLGGLGALGAPAEGTPSGVGGGVYGLFDLQNLLAEAAFDAYTGNNARLVAAGLGAYYAAVPENVTPYFGGGAKVAWTRFGGEGALGLQLFGAVGVLASRKWSPHVRVELAWFFDTMGERERGGGPVHYANGPIATIGLGF
jgi:hypothetical protein